MAEVIKYRNYAKWRTASLIGVYCLFLAHFLHWKFNDRTLAPLELNEVLFTIHQGIITAGFILMFLVMVATLIFGRFFCSWGCHILALQDGCAWILKKLRIKPRVIRSRLLLWIPFGAVFYLFIWPQILMMIHGVEVEALHIVSADARGGWSSFTTDNLWRNLPPVEIALSTFFICCFLLVYLMGSRSFCYYGCPYGAVFGLADQVAPARIALVGNCIQCGTCTANCSSDILVHKEIKEFGMVTSSRCLKDLDCIANCPEQALEVKFKKPPLFRKKFRLPQNNTRYSFTLGEDVSMLVVFIVTLVVYRGLYDAVPFLMSVGIAIASAYVSILCYRMWKKMSVKVTGVTLKISNRISRSGWAFMAIALLFYGFTAHSGYVHYHNYVGQVHYNTILHQQNNAEHTPATLVESSLHHFETALQAGFFKPLDLRKQMASLYLLQGKRAQAAQQLLAIIAADPIHVEALYRHGVMLLENGDRVGAKTQFITATAIPNEDMRNQRDFYMRGAAAFELGKIYEQEGQVSSALEQYSNAHLDDPNYIEPLVAQGALYMKSGQADRALVCFEQGLLLDSSLVLIHNNLAAIYAQRGNHPKAIAHYEKVVQSMPVNTGIRYNLGMLYYKERQLQEARRHLEIALQTAPNNEKIRQAYLMVVQEASTVP